MQFTRSLTINVNEEKEIIKNTISFLDDFTYAMERANIHVINIDGQDYDECDLDYVGHLFNSLLNADDITVKLTD